MSKKKIKTRDRILNKALEMFNARGIEYVGLREIAAILDIRVSNITYYFPTKDDLVNELTMALNQRNSELLVVDEALTLHTFLTQLKGTFQNQIQYRCLLLSMVHLIEQNKIISARHKQTQRDRNTIFKQNLKILFRNGYLQFEQPASIDRLADTMGLMARFWISEATISFRNLNPEEQMDYYLSLLAHLMMPYSTAPGEEQLIPFLNYQ